MHLNVIKLVGIVLTVSLLNFSYICFGADGGETTTRVEDGAEIDTETGEEITPGTRSDPNTGDEEDLGSCKEKKDAAESACSKSKIANTVGAALMPVLNTAAAIGEDDTSKVVCKQGDITKIIGAANAGVGAYCFAKVKGCINTCTEVSKACSTCEPPKGTGSPCPVAFEKGDDPETVAYDPSECGGMAEEAISACKEYKEAAIMALVQAGILGVTGAMMVNACKDMKANPDEEPPERPPNAPAPSPGNSPMSVGVSPLNPNKGPGQFAPTKTTPGQKQAGAPEEDPFGEKGEDGLPPNPFSSMGTGSSSLGGAPSGGFGGPSGGLPGGGGEEGDNDKGEGFLSGNYGGAEGFLSGGGSRRGGSSSRGGRGHSSYPGGGKKKGFNLTDGKDKLGPKREVSQFKSRHQSIFEIMSDLIQSFCREGQPVCE